MVKLKQKPNKRRTPQNHGHIFDVNLCCSCCCCCCCLLFVAVPHGHQEHDDDDEGNRSSSSQSFEFRLLYRFVFANSTRIPFNHFKVEYAILSNSQRHEWKKVRASAILDCGSPTDGKPSIVV